jgi:hypothetical protein
MACETPSAGQLLGWLVLRAGWRRPRRFIGSTLAGAAWAVSASLGGRRYFVGGSSVVEGHRPGWIWAGQFHPRTPAHGGMVVSCRLGFRARRVAQHPALAPAHSSPCGRDQAVDVGLGEINRGAVANVNDEDPSSVVGTERPAKPQQCFSHVPLTLG